MEKLIRSPAEILKSVIIKPIEQECLDRVFDYLKSKDSKKPAEFQEKIGLNDVANTLIFLGLRPTRN